MAGMKRKQIAVSVAQNLSVYDDFNGPIKDLIRKLREIQKQAERDSLTDVEIYVQPGYEESVDISVVGLRWETDAEFEKRKMKAEQTRAKEKIRRKAKMDKKERKERDQLARLKLKYEGKATLVCTKCDNSGWKEDPSGDCNGGPKLERCSHVVP
jgi:hypothetical protein